MAKLKVNDSEINLAASAIKCSADDFGATAPVRLYKASTGSWEYTGVCGVAVVIRNATINVVNILVVDLKTKVVALNQEVYKDFEYKVMTPYMHAFEGDDVIFGLNFAETFDATVFERTTKGLISVCNANIPAPSKPITTGSPKTVVSKPSQPTKTAQSTSSSQAQGGGIGSKFKGLFGIGAKKEAPRERPKISGAKNFKHVAHLGFNSKDGFGNIPPEWRSIFEKAGVTEEELKDAKTAKFILKTIASAGGPPPPPPQKESSQAVSSVSTGAPPPPGPPPPLMPTTKKAPPPPPSSKPGPDVSAPQESSSSGTGEGRGDMLAQIQQGNFKLKKVTAEDIPEVAQMSEQEQNTLASKIQLAMQARRQAVVDDDEDDDDEDWEI